jgi:hypothetical protein
VYHRCLALGDSVNGTSSYQYMVANAPFHIFTSYMEAMDLMVRPPAWLRAQGGERGGGSLPLDCPERPLDGCNFSA